MADRKSRWDVYASENLIFREAPKQRFQRLLEIVVEITDFYANFITHPMRISLLAFSYFPLPDYF